MALLAVGVLILAMAAPSSASWCVCKQVSDAVLQGAIDYACGNGADCSPLKPNGQCYNPNSIRNHCSYAVNSYFQRKSSYGATCDFGGAAVLTNQNPSEGTCSYPTGSSTSTGTGTPVTTVPTTSPTTPSTTTPVTPVTPVSGTPVSGTGTGTGTGTPVSGTGTGTSPTLGNSPTTTSPYSTTPTIAGGTPGVFGGPGTGVGPNVGLGPSASSMDDTGNAVKLVTTIPGSTLLALVISGIVWWWN